MPDLPFQVGDLAESRCFEKVVIVVHGLDASVLGLDFGQTVGDVHPSLHGTQVEQSTNISNSTLEGLEQAILKLKIERKTRISEAEGCYGKTI
ncbi:hypothetical protein AAZX31_05G234100 [Glycine max]